MARGQWQTPLGTVDVDEDLAQAILGESVYLREDASAHRMEHSLEVQLPFLQYIADSRVKIVPIVVAHLSREDESLLVEDLGQAMAQAMKDRDAIIIASTDLTHYEPKSAADPKDETAINEIIDLDWRGLLDVVEAEHISMCGAVPTAAAIRAAKQLGATRGELLKHYTSGDVIGDTSQVVGYGSLKLVKGG